MVEGRVRRNHVLGHPEDAVAAVEAQVEPHARREVVEVVHQECHPQPGQSLEYVDHVSEADDLGAAH